MAIADTKDEQIGKWMPQPSNKDKRPEEAFVDPGDAVWTIHKGRRYYLILPRVEE